jgi:cysteine desulfurase
MLPYFTRDFGNSASRTHSFGWKAEEAVKEARERVAALIGAEVGEIIFTSGATEAANLAIKGVFETYASKGNHIITTGVEHNAVLASCRHLEKLGAEVTIVPVNEDGRIDLVELEKAFRPNTILVSVMYANNETGVIMPVKEISALARKNNVLFFSDATQAVGKIPVDVNTDGIDLLTFSAHKLYGPKGVGALYVRRKNPRVKLTPQIDGGGHERGMRSGTLNVPGIVGFGKACSICLDEMKEEGIRLSHLRDELENAFLSTRDVVVNGDRLHRLPHVSNLSFTGLDAEGLIMSIQKDIAISSGSACTSAAMEPSHVLKAMGRDDNEAYAALRFGLGRFTTPEEIDFTIKKIGEAVKALRQLSAQQLTSIHVNSLK